MGATTFSGPVKAGTVREGSGANVGHAVLMQTGSTTHADGTALVQDITFYVPENAQIIDILVDTLVAYDSATSATLSVGTTSGNGAYASGINVKTATTRIRPTYTTGQLASMDDVGTNTAVVATITSVGDPSAGEVRVTITYAQK